MAAQTLPAVTDQKVYSVAVPAIANLLAASPEDAVKRLADALTAAGFDTLDALGETCVNVVPFEAEAGTQADTLPAKGVLAGLRARLSE